MLLPNGDVVTEGMLGENAKPQSERDCDGSWYCRYSIAGELLAKVKSAPWWYLFHNRDELGTPHGKMNIREDGYIWFSSEYTGELLSVWDFDGTRLPDTVPPQRSTLHFDWINAKLLETYYRVSNDAAPEQNT